MGPRVMKSYWHANLQPDQSPLILDLGSLTLQAVNPNPTPFLQTDPKAYHVALDHIPQWVSGGRVVLGPCFLPQDNWSGQP